MILDEKLDGAVKATVMPNKIRIMLCCLHIE